MLARVGGHCRKPSRQFLEKTIVEKFSSDDDDVAIRDQNCFTSETANFANVSNEIRVQKIDTKLLNKRRNLI